MIKKQFGIDDDSGAFAKPFTKDLFLMATQDKDLFLTKVGHELIHVISDATLETRNESDIEIDSSATPQYLS